MMNVFDKFKEERLNLEKISFDDQEVDEMVKEMPRLSKSDMKKSSKEFREHFSN